MKKIITILAATLSLIPAFAAVPVIKQADKDRAAALVQKMTLEEKCHLIGGYKEGFYTYPIERLGIKSILLADGPQGVRKLGETPTNSTYYPCGLAVAASWNREVAKGVGTGIGYDAKARGVGVMLCPGVNIYRNAMCGRNFEYMGEDPYLASETAASYITGMQEQGVMATIKHFAMNNQEYARHWVSSEVDERTINEIYFATFRKAVEKAHVGALMTSYNPINGTHAAENPWLIKQNLRKWGFEGIVMSDWVSNYTPYGSATSGLDLEMPRNYTLTYNNLKPLLDNGVISIADIDEKCQHILQSFIAYGFFDKPLKDTSIPEDYEVSRSLAYQAAVEAPVLLKNEGNILPLKAGNIVMVGPNADYIPFGGGSGAMYPFTHRTTTLFQGLSAQKGFKVTLRQAVPNAAELNKVSAIVVAVGFDKNTEKENSDRTYKLPKGQDDLIASAVATGKPVVVVVYSGGEVDMKKWEGKVQAILMAWYTGQESGKALADIITGKVSPSGRLPFTFWGSLDKNPATPYYKVRKLDDKMQPKRYDRYDHYPYTEYAEGIFVGYRGVEHFNLEPKYAFGYGLTYSSFAYSDIAVTPAGRGFDVTFTIANTGAREASEVAQVYVAPKNPSIVRPHHELKGYAKVKLAKGGKQTVTVNLPAEAFSYYDIAIHDWKVDAGEYDILVGASASDIKLTCSVNVK